jgi:hypothetical protein
LSFAAQNSDCHLSPRTIDLPFADLTSPVSATDPTFHVFSGLTNDSADRPRISIRYPAPLSHSSYSFVAPDGFQVAQFTVDHRLTIFEVKSAILK